MITPAFAARNDSYSCHDAFEAPGNLAGICGSNIYDGMTMTDGVGLSGQAFLNTFTGYQLGPPLYYWHNETFQSWRAWRYGYYSDGMGNYIYDTTINSSQPFPVNYTTMNGYHFLYPAVCTNEWGCLRSGKVYTYLGAMPPPVASFSCTPLIQSIDQPVVCTDTSTNSPTTWLWTLDADNLGIQSWQSHTGQNWTWYSHYPGTYGVNLQANNSAGGDWENKTSYVTISNLNVTSPYDLSLNSTSINFGGTISGTITSSGDPSLSNLNSIAYSFITPTSTPNTVNALEPSSTNNVMNYNLYGATWKGYQESTNDWTNSKSGIPNPAILTPQETGTITLQLFLNTKTGENYIIQKTISVGQGSFITTTFQAYDGTNYNILGGATINIKNLNTGLWTNGTYYNGKASITTPANQLLSAYGTVLGYYPAKYENAPADGTPYSLVFYQNGSPPQTGYQIFYVNTMTSTGLRVSGALVTALEVGTANTTHGTTNAAGVAQLNLFNSKLYTISATKTGYTGASTSYTTNTGMSDSITLILNPIPTATMTPITSWTAPSGNVTGFWAPWTNLFTQMGASSYEMPLLLAAFILLILMITGFAMAGILGGEIALGFGAILCVAIGLIPIWVVLAIIIIGFLFYGLKMVK
jgi:hypothetical protein